jgi:hypothetical protein
MNDTVMNCGMWIGGEIGLLRNRTGRNRTGELGLLYNIYLEQSYFYHK